MKNVLTKDILRDIKGSIGRFLSILFIVALGVAFFSGIKISPIVMKDTTDNYYDEYNLMDIRLLSTLGLTDSDVDEIEKIKGVDGVLPTYSIDVVSKYKDQEKVFRVHGLPVSNRDSKDKDYINRVKVVKGRLPEKSGECVVEGLEIKDYDIPIGTKLKLESGKEENLDESMKNTEYTVVGQVQTPYYTTHDNEESSIGSGTVSGFIMVPQSDFDMKTYTDIFLTVKGAKEKNTYKDDYFDLVDGVSDNLDAISGSRIDVRYNEVKKEATEKLKDGKKEFEDKKKEVENKLSDAENKLINSEQKLKDGKKQLEAKKIEVSNQIKNGTEEIAKGEKELKVGYKKYEQSKSQFDTNKGKIESDIAAGKAKLNEAKNGMDKIKAGISQLENQLNDENLTEEQRDTILSQIGSLKNDLDYATSEYNKGKRELDKGIAQYESAKSQLASAKALLEANKKKIEVGKENLKSSEQKAKIEFKKAEKELKEAKSKIASGWSEFEEAKTKANDELEKAEKKLKDAEDEVAKLKKPEWYILDRNSLNSYVQYSQAAENIDALASIFPVFFFSVAALVSLTTMTRMVDEQRINIGTLKALGYNQSRIAQKYIVYALSASLMGSVLGIAVGYTAFPFIIYNAYRMMFVVPPAILEFNIPIALGVTVVSILITSLAAYFSCRKELKETPSVLMRPKAPKNGKRIMLENLPFIWNKISFIGKVTIRNLFRYKKRFLMTVLGIAGCSALILTGFGIKDSIKMIVDRQFGAIYKYDMMVTLDNNSKSSSIKKADDYILKDKRITDYQFANLQNGDIEKGNEENKISIYIPDDKEHMKKFIVLKERESQKNVDIENNGVVLTEKLATKLGIKAGDKVELTNEKDKKSEVLVTGVVENYVSHYVYMSKDYYQKVFGREANYNRVFGNVNETSEKNESSVSKDLIKDLAVKGVSFNTGIKENFGDTVNNLNYVVLIMIISAGALAFVVLYNLTNVNISERIREIATIKVLGFHDNEVSAYIYRENILLTVVGTFSGIGIGKLLHRFIMVTLEVDNLMFGRIISPKSYILSIVITLLLGVIVNFAMYFKLKKVKMVESLKSID
ncbi:ABC transporter permease [Metaclostridioides mangenotii]|uniref:ABC transporter permease n=1 Tax=Metaclostridioides mangenotii TaxID=1540 RepID=UPI00048995DF|nr:ABC transporter permease [Clostridioides mangenotii]